MSDPIYTIAVLRAKQGRLDELKEVLESLASETRKEAGSIEYFFVEDGAHAADTIVSYEKWTNADDEAAHWQTPHLRHALARMKDILDGEPVIHRGPKII